MLQSNYLFIV